MSDNIYLDKKRNKKGSQSEVPMINIKNNKVFVSGYNIYNLEKNKIEYISKKKKYKIVNDFLLVHKIDCKTINDLGCNNGVVSYTSHLAGYEKTNSLDHDVECIALIKKINKHFNIENINVQKWSFGEDIDKCDITIMLALIHWIYSCTSHFYSFDKIFKYLHKITNKYLLIEWIDNNDGAIRGFKHINYNIDKHVQEYNVSNFEKGIVNNFGIIKKKIEVDGQTRVLYICEKK
jgi:hypothetical protein